jgi:hypothetical protein
MYGMSGVLTTLVGSVSSMIRLLLAFELLRFGVERRFDVATIEISSFGGLVILHVAL